MSTRGLLNAISIGKLVIFGFAVAVLTVLAIAAIGLRGLFALDTKVREFSNLTELTAALNADRESVLEARIAELTYRLTGDTAKAAEVFANANYVLDDNRLEAFLDDRPGLGERTELMHDQLRSYTDAFEQLRGLDRAFEGVLQSLALQTDTSRDTLKQIIGASFASGGSTIAAQARRVGESLLIAQSQVVIYSRSKNPEALQTAISQLKTAQGEAESMVSSLRDDEQRGRAEIVLENIKAMSNEVPTIEGKINTIDRISNGILEAIGASLQAQIDTEVEQITAQQQDLAERTDAFFVRLQVLMPIVILVASAIVAVVAATVVHVLHRRFTKLISCTEELASGNLKVKIEGVEYSHEIGRMAKALEVFRDTEAERRIQAEKETQRQEETRNVVSEARFALESLAKGDLTVRIREFQSEEFQELSSYFNSSAAQLDRILTEVVDTSVNISGGSDAVANAAENLATRTEQQASALAQTTATISEIHLGVERTAEGSEKTNRLVVSARERADHGRAVVDQTVEAMTRIQQSSDEISRIIGAIDDIAFQTNLLALNAGVEAARAGSAGQGFAVVAAEVRALAVRAGDAAREIKALIIGSQQQVEDGSRLANQASQALAEIAHVVATVNTAVDEINQSAQEQALSIREINSAMTELDNLTQQNAAMVEETTAASVELRSDVMQLRAGASVFSTSNMLGRTRTNI